MSKDTKDTQAEDLNKSIDFLIDELFEEVEKASSIDIAMDSEKTADEATKKAPKAQDDASRGAGRPKQISDVPSNDEDGSRDGQYDAKISENKDKEDESDEAKKQAKAIDQTSKEGHMAEKPAAPKMRPFMKSDISEEEMAEFEAFKKAKAEKEVELAKSEDLKKAEEAKKEQEKLIKSAVEDAVSSVKRENEELRKSFQESQAILKAMASQPRQPKSITSVEAVEKSFSDENKAPEAFSKSEILDAAFELAKSGKISDVVVSEIEMTNRCSDSEARAQIEKYLAGK